MTQLPTPPLVSREQYIELLNEITQAALTAASFQELVQMLANRLGTLFAADACHISLWDEQRQLPRPAAAVGPVRAAFLAIEVKPGQKTATAAVLQAEQVLVIPDVSRTRLIDPEIVALFPEVRSLLGLPLSAGGQKFGAALLLFATSREFSEQELAWAEQAAAQISLAVARSQLLENERAQRELAETLQALGQSLSETLELDALLDRLLILIARVVPYDTATFMLVAAGQARVVRHNGFAQFGVEIEQSIADVVLDVAATANLSYIAATGKPFVIPRVDAYDGWVKIAPFDYIASWAGAPIIIDSQLFGILSLDKSEPGYYTSHYLAPMEAFAAQASLSLSNALLHAETQRQLDELKTLREVALIGATALTEDVLIEAATRIIGEKLYPDNFGFLLYDEQEQVLRPHASYRPQEVLQGRETVSLDGCVAGQVFRTGRPWRIPDVREDPVYMKVDDRTLSELCVPLTADNQIFGVINAESARLNDFTDADERLLVTLAGQIATAIARIRLFASEQARREESETLREAIAAVNSSLDLEQVLDTILVQLSRVVPYHSAAIMLLEEEGLQLVAGRGFPQATAADLVGRYFSQDDPLMQQLRVEKRPLFLADAQVDPRFHSWGGTTYIRGWMGLPLITRGRVIGFLTVDNEQVDAYQEADAILAQSFAHQAATAIEHARLYRATEEARHRADRQAENLKATTRVLSLLNATPQIAEVFPEISGELKKLTGCQRVSVALFEKHPDTDEIAMIVVDGPEITLASGSRFRIEDTAVAADILAKRPHLTPDLAQEIDYPGEALLYQGGIRSRMNLPLILHQQAIGALNLGWCRKAAYDSTQLPLLLQISSAVALAVERSRLFTEINQHTEELEVLIAFSTSLRQAAYVDDMLSTITETITQVTPLLFAGILFVDPATDGDLVLRHEYPANGNRRGRRIKAGSGVTGHVARTGELYVSKDLATDPHVDIINDEARQLKPAGGSITLPLRTQERLIGVIHIILPKKLRPTESTLRLLVAIAEIAGSALDRALVLETLEQRVEQRTQELALANRRLQKLDQLKSKFVSDVSHELRTPVTNLRLYLDLLARGNPERHAHYLDVLRQQADRLGELIEDILNLSRMEMGRAKTKFAPVDLNSLVLQIVKMQLPRVEAAGLQIHYQLQPDLPPCFGEKNQLIQVFTNLLENAIRYTAAGEIEIKTNWDMMREQILLVVRDTGFGIHLDEREYIFDRFYRGQHRSQLNVPGTGLGLAIVKEIVDLHDGQIEVESDVGVGSTFRVWLPTVPDP